MSLLIFIIFQRKNLLYKFPNNINSKRKVGIPKFLKKGVKMSKNLPVSHLHEELIMNLKDALDLNSVSKSKMPVNTSKPEVNSNLESFAKKLGLNFAKNKEDLKKFYDFAGPDFIWPSKMNKNDHYEIFDFIIDPEWEDIGVEIATNALKYHRLIESETFEDKPKGSYVLIIHGKVLKYYEKDISSEDYEELEKKYPGKYFAPINRKITLLRRFFVNVNYPSSTDKNFMT